MANNNNDLTVNIKATFDKSNMGDFQSEVTKAIEDAAKSVKVIEIKANTQSARDSMQKFTSYLSKLSNAKDGFTTIKIHANTKDAEKAIEDLQSKLKDLKVSFDTSKLGNQLNVALRDLNKDDSLKKVKLGTDTSKLLRDINSAINTINNDSSLKKLKLGVDVNYLQQELNKAVKGLDTTVKLKTKLETTSRTSETKGTVTTNKTSKEEAQQYQSLFSKRAASIANLDRAYQEFGRNSKEVGAAIREFAAASKDVRKFGRDTGVLSLNKVKSDIERQLGAGLTTDFTKNWLRMEYDKVLKDIDTLNRQLKPEKYEKIRAKEEYQRLDAEHKDLAAQLKAVADAYKEEAAEVRRRTKEMKFRDDVNKGVSKGILQQLADSAKGDRRLDNDKMQRFLDELQNYRNLVGNNKSTFFTDISRDIGITSTHPYFNAMRTLYQSARNEEAKWKQNPITANVEVKGSEKVEELNQKVLTTTQQFMRLRGEALKAGNALNQATDPKDIARLKTEFEKAIQALVNYQRATRGLTKGGEAQLVEKLAVGNIKEQTEAYKVLVEWIKKAVQAQRDLDVTTGRKLPRKSNDTDLMSWFNNMDIGRAVSGMAYAARGELNAVQAFGNLLSNLSKVSGVVGIMVKGLGALALAGLAVYGVVNTVISAFSSLTGMLGRVANVIYDILRPGIELYKTRQTAELAIAAAISSRATENGKEIPFDRSMNISKEMMERVIADAAMSAFNPQELIDALRGTLPLALGKGWNLAQAYDVTKGVASVAKVINLAPNQVLQELRDILQGTISARSSQVAGATGITSEELKEAEAQGKLYEYIQEHLAKFTVALERYSTTLAGALDRLSETWALGMESVFQKIAPVANSLINEFIDSFIGVYKDSEGNILRNPADFYTTDAVTGEKVYKEAGFEWSEYIESFGDSLVDLVKFIAPIIDEILAFVQELTGKDDAIKAVVEMIKIAIRVTVSLGEFILSFAMGTVEAMNLMEAPISVLISGFIKLGETFVHLVGIGHFMSAAFVEIASTLLQASQMLTVGDIKGLKELPSIISNKIDKFSANYEALTKLGENINTPFATSFAELFGIDRESLQGKGGTVTELVERALNRADNGSNQPSVDWKQILGTAKEDAKQSYADQRKALQAFIEDLKQTLKEAIADIKDRMEQNDLAYQQGYKSIEDYFSQKAQLEYEEAQFRLQTLIAERNAIASLTPTNDSERYQWQRDLIKTDGEIALAQREANKKQDQLVETATAIERQLSIRPYQQGLGYNNTNRNVTSSYSVGSNNDLGQAMVDLAESSEWATKEMYHAGEGCVEFVTTFGAQFSDLLKEAAENQVWGMSTGTNDITPWLEEHGVQVEYNVPIELAKEIAKAGDIIAVNAGIHAAMAIGDGRVLHNSSSSYRNGDSNHIKNVEMDLWDDDTVNIIRTSSTMGQNITSLSNATEQLSQEAKDATTKIEQTRKDIAVSYEELQKRMPQALSKNVQAYLQASQDGQTRWLEAVKNYNLAINNNENMLIAVEASVASVATKLGREAQIMRSKYGQQFPELADALDKMIPIELLKSEAKVWEQYANNRLQMIEDDSKAINKKLREKSMLYPQAIEQYMSYFQNLGEYTITEQLQQMSKVADELAKQGAISEARNISKKIIEMRSKFSNMIQSWIDEMGNYFNYRKELVNADSGLTSFVKEERVRQLEKGQARVNAVAYGQEAMEWAKLEIKYQEQLNKIIEGRTDELDQTLHTDQKLLEMDIADVEILRQKAMRQAEINAKLGEQKTLWQETMDAANQALENGLYNFMTDYINTAESIGEAFRNMAIDILKDLQKFFAKKAITDLMHVITGTPNEQYNAPDAANIQTSTNTSTMVGQLTQANTYLAQIAGQNMIGSSPMLGTSSYGNYNYATSALPPLNSSLGMFGYQDYNTYKALTVSAPGVESSVATSTTQTVAATTGFQNQMVSMLPSLFGSLGGTLIGIIETLGTIAGSLGLLYLTYYAIQYILEAVVEVSHAILDAVVEIGHAILDAIVDISKEIVKLFVFIGGLILDWNTSAVGLARSLFGNSDDDAVEQTDAITLLSSILSTLSAIYGVNSAIASKLGVDTKDKTKESEGESEGDSTITTNTDTDISDSDTLLEENKMLVDSIYQRRVLEKLELIVSALNTMLRMNIIGLIMQLISIIITANAAKSFGSFKSSFGFATGGYISGKGTSTSDSIPAMLSNGEYVIKADSVRRYGLNFLDAVNNGHFTRMRTVIPRFADGGYVGDALQDTARGMTDFAKNIGTSVSTTNNMNVALVRNEQEAYEHFMRSPAGQRILVDFQKGNGRVFARFNR